MVKARDSIASAASSQRSVALETAESLARKQREISVSEFFLKNRHLLGFDSPRRALLTAVKEAVDNALDACEEAGIVPEISVDIQQTADTRFRVSVTDNGPGIVRAQIPKIFAKLLYGSKFHRLRMSRGQQGIGISAAGMYGQLTTGGATRIFSKTRASRKAHYMEVQVDTRDNTPVILRDEETDWIPTFFSPAANGEGVTATTFPHGTCVMIEMEAAYVRGRLSVDEYLKLCAVVNPHMQLHYRVTLWRKKEITSDEERSVVRPCPAVASEPTDRTGGADGTDPWTLFPRVRKDLPPPPRDIKPHPHGVELGMLMQMLKATRARTLRAALHQDFSRVSSAMALQICQRANLPPNARPSRIAQRESEALFRALNETRLMRPPTDCLSPIGEEALLAGMKREFPGDFYTAVTRPPAVYRGNPFQIEVGLACLKPREAPEATAEEPVRILRFANRVPLLYQAGACAITHAVSEVNWKNYGLAQPRNGLPHGPVVLLVHMASVWVPFTSESKEAIAHYPEILREMIYALQEGGRRLAAFLSRRRRQYEAERKRSYMELYIPHLAHGLRHILHLNDQQEQGIIRKLSHMLERTHVNV